MSSSDESLTCMPPELRQCWLRTFWVILVEDFCTCIYLYIRTQNLGTFIQRLMTNWSPLSSFALTLKFTSLDVQQTIKSWETWSAFTKVDNIRNFHHTDFTTNWELGLRESVHQALLREHFTDRSLRDHLLTAPLIGLQNTASPFGDIVIIAKGQLYINSEGFKFVHDSDQNYCIDCYNERCPIYQQCQVIKSLGYHHKLLALWTVKRIRHRNRQNGHIFEIEYTISPITSVINKELVKRNGYFNYNIPGHIFILKNNSRFSSNYFSNTGNKQYNNQSGHPDQNEDFRDREHSKHDIVIGVSPGGYKHVLHSLPAFYSSYHSQNHYNDQTIDPKEYELYKKLIQSLASKTPNVPHRFFITTPAEKTTKKSTHHSTSMLKPVSQATTFVRIFDGKRVPTTKNTVQPTPTHTVTPLEFPTSPESTQKRKYYKPDLHQHTLPSVAKVGTLEVLKPRTVPATALHHYTPAETQTSTITSKTQQDVILEDSFDIFSPKPYQTLAKKNTTHIISESEHINVFSIPAPTEPMQPITENPTSSSSINEQLPLPEEKDATLPYVSSTVVQFTRAETERITISTPITKSEETTTQPSILQTLSKTTEATKPFVSSTMAQHNKAKTDATDAIVSYVSNIKTSFATRPAMTETTIPYISNTVTQMTQPSTMSRKIITTFLSSVQRTVVGKNPYTQEGTRREEGKSTVLLDKISAVSTAIPHTSSIFINQEKNYNTKPTNFEYSFDSTTGGLGTTIYTEMSTTYYSGNQHPTTESTQFSVPDTRIHSHTPNSSAATFDNVVSTPSEPSTSNFIIDQFKSSSKKMKTIHATSTTNNDFLVDITNKKKKISSSTEDDIFGGSLIQSSTESSPTTTKRRTLQSDLAKALFGRRRSKQIKLSSKVPRKLVTNTSKIIFMDFYVPSTQTISATPSYTTTVAWPSTDQSYSTSISIEVNRRKIITSNSATNTNMNKFIGHHDNYQPDNTKSLKNVIQSVKVGKNETDKVFDAFALQLVNHARSIHLLRRKHTPRQPKYGTHNVTRKGTNLRITNNNNQN